MSVKIKARRDTPYVLLDENGIIQIEGRSLPEHVYFFYGPVFQWLDRYITQPADTTEIKIFLTYYNSSSFKCIADLLMYFKRIYNGHNVKITWMYEEDDLSILETGKQLEELTEIPFHFEKQPVEE